MYDKFIETGGLGIMSMHLVYDLFTKENLLKLNDKKLKALYAIMEDDIMDSAIEYTDEVKQELDKRQAAYKAGKAKVITATESKRRIKALLSKGKRKWVTSMPFLKLLKENTRMR